MPGKRIPLDVVQLIYYNYQKGKSVKELSEIHAVTTRTVYNIINRAENEGRLEAPQVKGRPKKLSNRQERNIIKKIDKNPQLSTRSIANEVQTECGVTVSHETIRQTLLKNKYTSRVARKKPLLSSANISKRLLFANEYISEPDEFWDDVIFCDETKIMLYYNEGPNRVWRLPLTALQNKNIIPTVKFGKLSVMVWGCISSKGVGELVFIDGHMDAKQYLDILKKNLIKSAKKLQFNDENSSMKATFKFYQDNDPKHKEQDVKLWLLYNCNKVFDTPAQSPDMNPIENLWAHLKKKVGKRNTTNKNQLKQFIVEEWANIPKEYDLKRLVYSMKNRLQAVINSNGNHTKY